MSERICRICDASFPYSGFARPYATCPDCRPGSTAECPGCRDTFTRRHAGQKFCGNACSLARYTSDPEHQRTAGKVGGRVRGEQLTRERTTDWYSKRDGEHVHRVVAAEVLGRPLEPEEVVHHEDLNKMNNDPENLIVFPSQTDHARHHRLNHPGAPCECPGIRLKEVMPHDLTR